MSEILLLEEIADKVLEEKNEQFSLFGKRNFSFNFKQRKYGPYDFLFHYIPEVPISKLDEGFLIIPFLSEDPESKAALKKIYKINQQKPFIETFGFKTNEPHDVTRRGIKREETGQFLRFYDLENCALGKETLKKKTYFTVSETNLKENLLDKGEVFDYISEKRKEIDEKYRI